MIETNYKVERILPYKKKDTGKKEQVKDMFNTISTAYDAMNKTMTMGIDASWRKRAINSLKLQRPNLVLDVATGTGDLAIEIYKKLQVKKVVGIDISDKMLEVGRIKVSRNRLSNKIELLQGDCMQLKYEDESFDAVSVAFGVRNFENLHLGLSEMYRVLKKKGSLVILELSEPYLIFKPFYAIYTKLVIPIIAFFANQDVYAYQYLPNTIKAFPKGKEMKEILTSIGFSEIKYRRYTFGICSFYLAKK